ncbi:Pentatricopeptide repeat-containing protein [Glycine soja]|uniref:Pentatricopeptide repeat-containing protein n=1 Tax=Glycine soja TaxID=3848 RepID=A0A445FGT1_GLYSO|nr:Pentatricopeptide repeat-containing protein [Glycine soja]
MELENQRGNHTPNPSGHGNMFLHALTEANSSTHDRHRPHQRHLPPQQSLAFCALADAGDIRYAHRLIRRIPEPNTFMWNSMIRGYNKARIPSTAFSFFLHMFRGRVPLDARTFVFALKACELFSEASQGESVHSIARKTGFDFEVLARNGLVHFYADRDAATEMFNLMLDGDVEPNEVTLIAVLSA